MTPIHLSPTLVVVLAALAVWRLTHLFQAEDGPWQLLARARRRVGDGVMGTLLDCFYCLSVWIALPFALWIGGPWSDRFLLWLGLSGAAILLERATRAPDPPELTFHEDPEDSNVLLRQPPSSGVDRP